MRLSWFDAHIGPEGSKADPPPAVRLLPHGRRLRTAHAEGRPDHGGHWRTATSWPPEETADVTLVLGGSGTLATVTDTCDAQGSFLERDFDPHPVELHWDGPRDADRGIPRPAGPDAAERILSRLQRLSEPFGTEIAVRDGVGHLHL
ncbi:hypothetical protein AB0I51_41635 [Streptomyces sp. NPDC050549]|uniref:hypothetical protein n=1 Tax=Streptomyces sp. NPDC050549 TaxID=3155406 RepID=UPI0034248529